MISETIVIITITQQEEITSKESQSPLKADTAKESD